RDATIRQGAAIEATSRRGQKAARPTSRPVAGQRTGGQAERGGRGARGRKAPAGVFFGAERTNRCPFCVPVKEARNDMSDLPPEDLATGAALLAIAAALVVLLIAVAILV